MDEILSWITRAVFLLLGALSLLDALRYRERVRLDIALMFNAFSLSILLQVLQAAFGYQNHYLALAGTLALVAQPYLLLRVVEQFRPVPRRLLWIAALGGAASWALLLVYSAGLPTAATLFVVATFILVDGYAAWAFLAGALRLGGVSRSRMAFASSGTGLLALVILSAGLGALRPGWSTALAPAVQIAAALAAITYYLGFSPPRWLRKSWQLFELQRFLHALPGARSDPDTFEAKRILCEFALHAVGGLGARAVLWQKGGPTLLHFKSGRGPTVQTKLESPYGIIGRAREERRTFVSADVSEFGADGVRVAKSLGAGIVMIAVPIVASRHALGVLLIFLARGSLFLEDDLELLELLAEQSALTIEYRQLLTTEKHRSAQVEAANQELEAFSYSVSHDLRAPLRSMDGFSQALLEDYADRLDDTGKDYLMRIRSAAQRMGSLIDDLISLAQVARADLAVERLDLGEMAGEIIASLQSAHPGRQVELNLQELPPLEGDPGLVRVALQNLLGNAWKFTRDRNPAVIEVGASGQNGQMVYYVRDNGAGFDMAYAGKLFAPFQRLHSTAEFDGTGIGLAIVQRIVRRHGGRVWAEGEVERGATIYFTL